MIDYKIAGNYLIKYYQDGDVCNNIGDIPVSAQYYKNKFLIPRLRNYSTSETNHVNAHLEDGELDGVFLFHGPNISPEGKSRILSKWFCPDSIFLGREEVNRKYINDLKHEKW